MALPIKQLHQGYRQLNPNAGLGAKPNIYRRTQAREMTDVYLAEVERKAAGVDLDELKAKRNRALEQAFVILAAIGLIVALWVF